MPKSKHEMFVESNLINAMLRQSYKNPTMAAALEQCIALFYLTK